MFYGNFTVWLESVKKVIYYITSISKFGIAVFFITLITSFFLSLKYFKGCIYRFDLIPIGIALITTFIFELIYNLIRRKFDSKKE